MFNKTERNSRKIWDKKRFSSSGLFFSHAAVRFFCFKGKIVLSVVLQFHLWNIIWHLITRKKKRVKQEPWWREKKQNKINHSKLMITWLRPYSQLTEGQSMFISVVRTMQCLSSVTKEVWREIFKRIIVCSGTFLYSATFSRKGIRTESYYPSILDKNRRKSVRAGRNQQTGIPEHWTSEQKKTKGWKGNINVNWKL